MTPVEQHKQMSIRIVDEALAVVRQRAEDDELASHLHRLCDDAAEAQHECDAHYWPALRLRHLMALGLRP